MNTNFMPLAPFLIDFKIDEVFLNVLEGIGYRSVTWGYAGRKAILSGEGGYQFGGRWSPPGIFRAVYASCMFETATQELLYGQRVKGLPLQGILPRIFLSFEFRCEQGLDLTEDGILEAWGLTATALTTCDWLAAQEQGRQAISQQVGLWAWQAGVEVMKVPSAAHAEGANWVFFPENFKPKSQLLLHLPPDWPL